MRNSERVRFAGGNQALLSGIVDSPAGDPLVVAIFAHCFTCTKDLKAIVKISRRLAEQGFQVLRFDFTGLGDSQGDFSDTNFSGNIRDALAAAKFMRENYQPPRLLIGHSLGGAAMMAAASQIPEAGAIATLASPSDTQHLAELLTLMNRDIIDKGQGEVTIGGLTYLIKRQMIDDLKNFDLPTLIRQSNKPQLILHSPIDRTLALHHATRLAEMVGQQASLVSLQEADHLLTSDQRDVEYVADLIATWAKRNLDLTN